MAEPLTDAELEAIEAKWRPVEHEPWCATIIVCAMIPEPCDCGREPQRDPHRDIARLLAEVRRLRAAEALREREARATEVLRDV